MITTRTVFVLGAGASMDFSYPSGSGLKGDVINMTNNPNSDAYRTLLALGNSPEYIEEFHEALRFSGRPSVDAFLEHRTIFMKVGKACMALALVTHEHRANLFSGGTNWYDYLFLRMSARFSEFAENQIAVVTFNYDRSLETYLFEALKNAYGQEEDAVAEAIGQIPLIHVHGKLADLPWQTQGGRPYAPTYDPEDTRLSAAGIRVISESSKEDEGFAVAREVLRAYDRVVFLGFGFHRANFARLRIDLKQAQQRFHATCYDFTNLDQHEISQWFKPSVISFGNSSWKVLQFLRENILL